MVSFVNKIILLCFALYFNALAKDPLESLPDRSLSVSYDTNKVGMIRYKRIFSENLRDYEYITTIHDKKGKLLFYSHYVYKKRLLVRMIENGIVTIVVPGASECDFKIIKSSGAIVSFKLDPEKSPEAQLMSVEDEDIAFFKHLKVPKTLSKDKYESIVNNWWYNSCGHPKDFSGKLETKVWKRNGKICD